MTRTSLLLALMVCTVPVRSPVASASPANTTADVVLGQLDFTGKSINQGKLAPTAATLQEPQRMAIDPTTGRLWLADSLNNRVLSWPSPATLTNDQAADIVLGQPDPVSNLPNGSSNANTPPTNKTMDNPRGVAFDSAGRLYVADTNNFRVLRFDPPIASNAAAIQVFGQNGSFTTKTQANQATPTANDLGNPLGIAVDSKGNLYVADRFIHRISIYLSPATTDTTADLVIGQPNVTTGGFNQGGNPDANTLGMPIDVCLDANDNLYVADEANNRVLQFLAPLSNNQNASRVFGQPSFTVTNSNSPTPSASSMADAVSVAIDPVTGHLFTAEGSPNRVLEFNTPLGSTTPGPAADRVYGQGGAFNTNTINKGGVSADSLADPAGLVLDSSGNLYVADRLNHRLLRFNAPVADVSIAIADQPDPVTTNASLVYTITVSNAGPDSAQAVTVSDTLPANVTFVSAVASVGNCSGTSSISCNLGDLAASANATITITVTPTVAGNLSNTASAAAASNDPSNANNSATATTTVNAPSGGNGNTDTGDTGTDTGTDTDGTGSTDSNSNPGCGGSAGASGCGAGNFLPLTMIGLGGLKRRSRRHFVEKR